VNPELQGFLRVTGRLCSRNVRLSHVLCNREDYGWRMRIRRMLEKGVSLDEIAENLNLKGVRAPHGRGKWSAATVRKAFVS
jgi:DNA-binding transcriptional MerR regulator